VHRISDEEVENSHKLKVYNFLFLFFFFLRGFLFVLNFTFLLITCVVVGEDVYINKQGISWSKRAKPQGYANKSDQEAEQCTNRLG